MLEEYILIRYKNDLNALINQPLQLTNRIKFTCFDVSSTYIVFGATSGGIYIYSRKPCSFLKLLPSKEGAITNILISGDEKVVAMSTAKGLILLSVNPFETVAGDFLVFTEHENNNVTAMNWHQNFLYTGDQIGNVAVIDVNSSFKKSIFKVPSASLMLLDSAIVQFCTFSKYLLISTESKTYLCDTDEEHYKQIGKKLRSGKFGCCFLPTSFGNNDLIKPEEQVKIICARPGCRLWEADFTCQVIRTHQFKETLTESKSEVVCLPESTDGDLEISSYSNNLSNFQNFRELQVLDNKFVLTFNSKGFYVFDISKINVLSWILETDNVKDVRCCKNYIYVWSESSNVIVLSLTKLENILRKTLAEKQFDVCTQLCLHFKNDLMSILKRSDELHLLHVLKQHLEEKSEIQALQELSCMFDMIEESKISKVSVLENGIHVLNNLKTIQRELEAKKTNSPSEIIGDNNVTEDPSTDVNYSINLLYKLYKISNSLEMKSTHKIFETKDLKSVIELLGQFVTNVAQIEPDVNSEIPKLWCYNQFLYYIQETENNFINVFHDAALLPYAIEAFKSVNYTEGLTCTCSFPLPIVKKHLPKYYNIGCAIVKYVSINLQKEECISDFVTHIPYMWKHLLRLKKNEEIASFLPVIVQFSDEDVLNHFSHVFTYDNWDKIVRLLIKLKKKVCLNCEKRLNCDDNGFNWSKLGTIMVENIGSVGAIKLLIRYADEIDSNELGADFYQTCIFATVMHNHRNDLLKKSTTFMRNVQSGKTTANEISSVLNKYLTSKHSTQTENNEVEFELKSTWSGNCAFCDLPLSSPVLKDVVDLSCGHFYHNICHTHLNKICTLCTKVE